jgi:surface polysaccharide O-acyltransferase-like enzyme
VDLIRTFAIVLVILLHASIEPVPAIVTGYDSNVVVQWWSVNIYDSLARPCVPLFVMLSGALLLQPSKVDEPLKVFFKKRVSRIVPPLIFWMAAYFVWRVFVNGETLSLYSIGEGIIWGPYIHFWFIYMLIGLYLITPFLRVLVAHASRRLIRYFLVLWLVGTAVVPLLGLFVDYSLNNSVFLLTGYVGYYVLGLYLLQVQLKKTVLLAGYIAGFVWTAVGTYIVTATVGGSQQFFFYDNLNLSVILTSATLFLLLSTVQSEKLNRFPRLNRLLHFISQNSLGIYLFHFMVIETLQNGYLGLRISVTTLNPILGIPLLTGITLLICLLVIYPLRKIPLINKIIG